MVKFTTFDQHFSNRRLLPSEQDFMKKTSDFDTVFKEEEIPDIPAQEYSDPSESDPESRYLPGSTQKKKKKTVPYNKRTVVTIFGRYKNEAGEPVPVAVHIIDFYCHFYVKVPKKHIKEYEKYFAQFKYWAYNKMAHGRIAEKHKESHFGMELIFKIDADGFTNKTYVPFIKLTFRNLTTRQQYFNYLKSGTVLIMGCPIKLYEGRCYPYMKFYHESDTLPVSEVEVTNFINVKKPNKQTRCPIEIVLKFKDLKHSGQADLSLLVNVAFDIETAPLISGALHPILESHDPIIAMPLSFKILGQLYNLIPMYLGHKNEDPEADGYTIIPCKTERELLLTFIDILRNGPSKYDSRVPKYCTPDVMLSYNGNGYDWNYIATRAKELDLFDDLAKSSKYLDFNSYLREQDLSSSAFGKNVFRFMEFPGIINLDQMPYFKKLNAIELVDLKLDTVAREYLSIKDKYCSRLESGNDLEEIILGKRTLESYKDTPNYPILEKIFKLNDHSLENIRKKVYYNEEKKTMNILARYKLIYDTMAKKISTEESKYDLSYFTMYDYIKEAKELGFEASPHLTTEIAKYSIQDCVLLHKLDAVKMITLATSTSANTSKILWKTVMISGSGVPIYSVVVDFANKKHNKLLPDRFHNDKEYTALFTNAIAKEGSEWKASYEGLVKTYEGSKLEKKIEKLKEEFYDQGVIAGGFVKPPKPGKRKNTATLDVNSEYPSIMRTHNLSFDTIVLDDEEYGNIEGISYTVHKWETIDGTVHENKFVCDYENHTTDGVLPEVLEYLVNERSRVRKLQKNLNKNSQEWSTLEAIQIAIKVLCNSVYGTTVDKRSRIECKPIGGCTTALSREYIKECARLVSEHFENVEIVYGDTDSFFAEFTQKTENPAESLLLTWNQAKEAENLINEKMQKERNYKHMKIELEKVFSTLILYDKKKKYFGKMHESPDINVFTIKTMGVKHKKRDSSPIEKFVGSYIEDLVIAEKWDKIFPFVNATIKNILDGLFDSSYFTKSAKYNPDVKNPGATIGTVIYDILKNLDPGNPPQVGQRMFYTYCKFPENAGKARYKIKKCEIAYPIDFIGDKKIDYGIFIEHFLNNIRPILELADGICCTSQLDELEKKVKRL